MLFRDGSLGVVLTQWPYTTALHHGSFAVVLTQSVDEGGIPQQVVSQSVSGGSAWDFNDCARKDDLEIVAFAESFGKRNQKKN